jgi:hypothetical protein
MQIGKITYFDGNLALLTRTRLPNLYSTGPSLCNCTENISLLLHLETPKDISIQSTTCQCSLCMCLFDWRMVLCIFMLNTYYN